MDNGYTSKDIKVINSDLEAIRKHSTMYIGHTGMDAIYHLLRELVDNSVDEFKGGNIKGYATYCKIQYDGKYLYVSDDGRGIPDDDLPTFINLFTKNHSSGKFSGDSYNNSRGLHGIGLKLITAMSENVFVIIGHGKKSKLHKFESGLYVDTKPFKSLPKEFKSPIQIPDKFSGTVIIFNPIPSLFGIDKVEIDNEQIKNIVKMAAYFNPKFTTSYIDICDMYRTEESIYCFENGIKDYMDHHFFTEAEIPTLYAKCNDENNICEISLKFALTDTGEYIEGYTNSLYNPEGGTHVGGFKVAFTNMLKPYFTDSLLSQNKLEQSDISGDILRKGLACVISMSLKDPKYSGQSKAKLLTPDLNDLIKTTVSEIVNQMDIKKFVKTIITRVVELKLQNKVSKVKTGDKQALSLLNTKLTDCYSKNTTERELWILEGDSAAGSAKQARNPLTQAILPLTGKPLNTFKLKTIALLNNEVFKNLINILGCGIGKSFDITKLRYGKIILLADKDPDGDHITVLLLTFFIIHLPELILQGKVYLSNPPFYVIRVGEKKYYCNSEKEKDKMIKDLKNYTISRFKGIGEMNFQELESTTMNDKKRILTQCKADDLKDLLSDIY